MVTKPVFERENCNTTTRPLTPKARQRAVALHQSSWPIELFNEIARGRDGTGEIVEVQENDGGLFGTHIKEVIDEFYK